jgi:Zn-dependent oligopeptidase
MTDPDRSANPFFQTWTTPDGAPPFDRIRPEHFREAYARAFAEHDVEVAAIAAQPEPPDFANTIAALELSGRLLERVGSAFYLLVGAHSDAALLEIEREIAPQLARHWNRINTNEGLFRRIDALMRGADGLDIDAEQKRVLERYHVTFRRAGAALGTASRARLIEIMERLATLGTAFSQHVLADEQAFALQLTDEAELTGLPAFMRETMKGEARERGTAGHVVTLSRSSALPFLQFSTRRDLREKVFRAFVSRGDNNGPTDNKAIIAEMVELRAERARLLGYADFAQYRLDDAMAKTPAAVRDLLQTVWAPARERALADCEALQALVQEEGGNFALAPWDWRYCAEKLRQRRCDFDEAAINPYLTLDRVVNVCNFNKGSGGEPTLLSFEDARTLFHEFGHALHGLLSAVTYPKISGTNVAADFVELPSQLYEHWLEQPDVLRRFARHYRTGVPMPEDLLRRLIAARNFDQGFATVEYVASAMVDLDLHALASPGAIDATAFEREALSRIAMPEEIAMRHRLPQFGHIFAGDAYAAAYYSYMWSEVLDADAFAAFEETGDIFDPATAKRLRETIYAAGGARDPAEAYKAFRGRLPSPQALLRKRGFAETAVAH